jgi:hypothetical protein
MSRNGRWGCAVQEELTPEQQRAKAIAEYNAEILREMDWESYEEYTILMINELEEFGGYSGDELLEMLDDKPVYHPHWL